MTHTVNGNIIAHGKIPEYDSALINSIVMEFSKRNGIYRATYDPDFKRTLYSRIETDELDEYRGFSISDSAQPFITVMDKPRNLMRYAGRKKSPLKGNLSVFVTVSSGSHVGIPDVPYSQEIVDVTLKLHETLEREFPTKTQTGILFDDRHEFYSPSQFIELIKEATKKAA
jgi:hypothetical protein